MKFYNSAIYNRRDDLEHGTVVEVNDSGFITSIEQNPNYKPEAGDFDCNGYVMFPSFMDCAVIMPGRGIFSNYGLDLSRYNEALEYLYAIESYSGDRLRAFGYNTYCISEKGTHSIKTLLDKKWSNAPAYVLADDLTTVIVNEYILEIAKNYFSVDRHLHHEGELDYYQLAVLRAKTDLFSFSSEELIQGLLSFQYEMLINGITSVRVMDTLGGSEVIEAVQQLYDAGSWVLRTIFTVPLFPFETEEEMWKKYEKYLAISNSRTFVTGVTIALDGSIDSAQAAMLDKYNIEDEWYGDILWSMSKLRKITSAFIDAGIDVNIRAYGDKAVSVATFVLSGNRADYASGRRIITHAYLMSDEDISICSREGIAICLEPNSVPYNSTFYEGDLEMLGEDRCYDEYPVGRIMYGGVTTVAGSNYPTQKDLNPIHGVFKATHRVASDDVTLWRVLTAYGECAYKLFGMWNVSGELVVGKKADFVLLNKDVLHMNESLLMNINIEVTVIDGRIMHKDDGES